MLRKIEHDVLNHVINILLTRPQVPRKPQSRAVLGTKFLPRHLAGDGLVGVHPHEQARLCGKAPGSRTFGDGSIKSLQRSASNLSLGAAHK